MNSDIAGDFVIRKSVSHADEDGTLGAKVIDVTFNTGTLMFSAMLPDYVARYAEVHVDPEITCDTAQGVIETYEVRCDEYSNWCKSRNVPTQLWIGLFTSLGEFGQHTFGVRRCCGIGVTLVKALPDGRLIEVCPETGELGTQVGSHGNVFKPVLIDDTPEHREKVKQLSDSIQRAADILSGLHVASNPSEYLMAIRDDWQPSVPKQIELPVEPVDDEL